MTSRVILFAALLVMGCARPDAGTPAAPPSTAATKPVAEGRVAEPDSRVRVGGVRVHPDLLTGDAPKPGPHALPVAPPPRKVVRCTCIYCSCTHKPNDDFPQFNKCRCDEQRCKDNKCECDKWKKKGEKDDD